MMQERTDKQSNEVAETGVVDVIEQHGESIFQHGKLNDRVYVMKVAGPPEEAAAKALEIARREGYGKVFAKVPEQGARAFRARGYRQEAHIPEYFDNGDRCRFMSFFVDPIRVLDRSQSSVQVLRAALTAASNTADSDRIITSPIRTCTPDDARAMASLYGRTFSTYPFPINDPEYIVEAMAANVTYSGIWHQGEPLALSAAERDRENSAVEMTDFVVAPTARGRGLAWSLLEHMENTMRAEGIRTAFTIARAESYGMNITFARQGYAYGGRLVNNTSICGRIESMNVWHKTLSVELGVENHRVSQVLATPHGGGTT